MLLECHIPRHWPPLRRKRPRRVRRLISRCDAAVLKAGFLHGRYYQVVLGHAHRFVLFLHTLLSPLNHTISPKLPPRFQIHRTLTTQRRRFRPLVESAPDHFLRAEAFELAPLSLLEEGALF